MKENVKKLFRNFVENLCKNNLLDAEELRTQLTKAGCTRDDAAELGIDWALATYNVDVQLDDSDDDHTDFTELDFTDCAEAVKNAINWKKDRSVKRVSVVRDDGWVLFEIDEYGNQNVHFNTNHFYYKSVAELVKQ